MNTFQQPTIMQGSQGAQGALQNLQQQQQQQRSQTGSTISNAGSIAGLLATLIPVVGPILGPAISMGSKLIGGAVGGSGGDVTTDGKALIQGIQANPIGQQQPTTTPNEPSESDVAQFIRMMGQNYGSGIGG